MGKLDTMGALSVLEALPYSDNESFLADDASVGALSAIAVATDALVGSGWEDPCYILPFDGLFCLTDRYAMGPKQWVSIAAVQEISDDFEDDDSAIGRAGIAFEVTSSFGQMELQVSVETWVGSNLLDSCLFPVSAERDGPSLYKICLAVPCAQCTLRFLPFDSMGCIVGDALVLPLQNVTPQTKHFEACGCSVSEGEDPASTRAGSSSSSSSCSSSGDGPSDCGWLSSSSTGSSSPQCPA